MDSEGNIIWQSDPSGSPTGFAYMKCRQTSPFIRYVKRAFVVCAIGSVNQFLLTDLEMSARLRLQFLSRLHWIQAINCGRQPCPDVSHSVSSTLPTL